VNSLSLKEAYESASTPKGFGKYPDLEILEDKIPSSESVLHLIKGVYSKGSSGSEKSTSYNVIWIVTDKGVHTCYKTFRTILAKTTFRFVPYHQINAIEINTVRFPFLETLIVKRIPEFKNDLCEIKLAFGVHVSSIRHGELPKAELLCQTVSSYIDVQRSAVPETNPAEGKSCPDCAESVKSQARKCRFCGFEFS
jgi:hypothetical protein